MTLRLADLRQHADVLALPSGKLLMVRFAEPGDAAALQDYFRSLSVRSRHNRFLGGISELPPADLEHFTHAGERDRFSVIALTATRGRETIIGEARYAFDAASASFEFALSVDDGWQGQGIGSAVLSNLQCRAAAYGGLRLFGDTLRTNNVMIGLARKSGFTFAPTPNDWRLVRFVKQVGMEAEKIPCASWRLAVQGRPLTAFASH